MLAAKSDSHVATGLSCAQSVAQVPDESAVKDSGEVEERRYQELGSSALRCCGVVPGRVKYVASSRRKGIP